MNTKKLMKGLLCATAMTAFSAGSAYAQNNFTAAGEDVDNTFTLNYDVGGVTQPPITPPAPTSFKVDRLVNVTVAAAAPSVTVAPGQTDAFLSYTVTNNGNDTHAYLLGIEQDSTNGAAAGSDNFDTTTPASGLATIRYRLGTSGPFLNYDPLDPPVLDADDTMQVRVYQDIPTEDDGEQADIFLFADTQTITSSPGDPITFVDTTADTDGNDETLTENVLADEAGDATGDAASDGTHSDTSVFIVAAADVTAAKTVQLLSQDGAGCVDYGTTAYDDTYVAPSSLYHVPGACVEYTIAVENDGSQAATNIALSDILPEELLFVDASLQGALTAGTFSEPTIAPGDSSVDCAGGACTVSLTNGSIAGTATPGTPTTGAITIRALIK